MKAAIYARYSTDMQDLCLGRLPLLDLQFCALGGDFVIRIGKRG